MSLINKINFQYKFRVLKELVDSKKYEEFFIELEKTKKNYKNFSDLSMAFVSNIIKNNENDIFDSKIVWLNSFFIDDLFYLNNFISFYFNYQQKIINTSKSYEEEISEVFKSSNENIKVSFEDLLDNSYLYQWLILQKSKNKYNFINNQMPFFLLKITLILQNQHLQIVLYRWLIILIMFINL